MKKIKTSKQKWKLQNSEINVRKFDIGRAGREFLTTRAVEANNLPEVFDVHKKPIRVFEEVIGEGFVRLPYTFPVSSGRIFGDLADPRGQNEYQDMLVFLSDGWHHPYWFYDLYRFAQLFQEFRPTELGSHACLRGFRFGTRGAEMTIGTGRYDESYFSMGSDGLPISLSLKDKRRLMGRLTIDEFHELTELCRKLQKKYGQDVSIRQVVVRECGGLPDFNEQVYNHTLGVAGVVLTDVDEYVLLRRTPDTTSMGHGINVTASGAVDFNRTAIMEHGLPIYFATELLREARTEVGLYGSQCGLTPVAFLRELPRGGSPEVLFLIRYWGDTMSFVNLLEGTVAAEREFNGEIFTIKREEARTLIRQKDAMSVVQHKALATIIMIERFLERNRV